MVVKARNAREVIKNARKSQRVGRRGRKSRTSVKDSLATYTLANAAWTAALRTFTATTGFNALTAASNGASVKFS